MEEVNGSINGIELESPFEEPKEEAKNTLNRKDLMLMTAKELVRLAEPKSRFKKGTLLKFSKAELCDIILEVKNEKEAPRARASRVESESEQIINFVLDTLNSIKQQRDGKETQINPIAKEIFKSSSVSKVDEARADGNFNTDKFNNILLVGSGVALAIDGLIGFNNIPKIFNKIRNKKKIDNDTK